MRRREFIGLIGGAAAWPLEVVAQQTEHVRRIGFLLGLSEDDPEARTRITAFREGLKAAGWTEARNIRIDYRFAGGDRERVSALAKELVDSAPDVIIAQSTPVVAALKQATSTIPIVFVAVNEPVGQGLVKGLAHPGGNITGFSFVEFEMIGKCLGLLKEIAPGLTRANFMFDPDLAPYFSTYLKQIGALPGPDGGARPPLVVSGPQNWLSAARVPDNDNCKPSHSRGRGRTAPAADGGRNRAGRRI